MRFFLALFVVLLFAGCGANNPIQSGSTGAPSRITISSDDDSDAVAGGNPQLMPAGFENPLSTFDFTAVDSEWDLEPDEVRDPDSTETPLVPDDVDDGGGGGDLEPEVTEVEGDDEPDSDDADPDDDLEPEVVGGDDDPDSGVDDLDEFGLEVVE